MCVGSRGRVELGNQGSNRQTCRAAPALHDFGVLASTARTNARPHDGSEEENRWKEGSNLDIKLTELFLFKDPVLAYSAMRRKFIILMQQRENHWCN